MYTCAVSISGHVLPKEREPNKIFNLSFDYRWAKYIGMHEGEKNLQKKGVLCNRLAFCRSLSLLWLKFLLVWLCGWINLSQQYFYSSFSRANLQALPPEMRLTGPLNLISNVAWSQKEIRTEWQNLSPFITVQTSLCHLPNLFFLDMLPSKRSLLISRAIGTVVFSRQIVEA